MSPWTRPSVMQPIQILMINAVNINILCLSVMHTGASTELLFYTNHTTMHD